MPLDPGSFSVIYNKAISYNDKVTPLYAARLPYSMALSNDFSIPKLGFQERPYTVHT